MHAVERYTVEHLSPEELVRAVDIAPATRKEEPNEAIVDPREHAPAERITAHEPVADHHIHTSQGWEHEGEVAQVELSVAIGVEDVRHRRGRKAGPDRPTVATVRSVVNDPNGSVALGETVGDGPGAVATSVVDDDDLEVVRKTGEHREGVLHHGLDVVLFVVGGKKEGESG